MVFLNKWLASVTIVLIGLSSASVAQTPYDDFLARAQSEQFNTSVVTLPAADPLNSVQMMMGQPSTTIQIDITALFSLPDFQIELPGLENIYAVNEKVLENTLGGQSWIGDVVFLDPAGFGTGIQGRAYFVESASGVTGTIHTVDSVIQIYPDGAGGQVMVSEDPSFFDREGEILSEEQLSEGGHDNEVAASPLVGGRRDGVSPATVENPYTIDVLWVTTPLARESGADMEALIELANTTGNDVLINSGVPAQMRVVGIHNNTTYQEDSSSMQQTLYDLRDPVDGDMDEVHSIRTNLGADMVAAVSGATNYCGIAYIDASYGWAFSVNGRGCMSGYTPIHEFGHNFGAHHDIANGRNNSYTFGQGLYNNTVDPYWRTVMSYACPDGPCSRIPYYSNSQQTYNDLPLGDPEEFDNARVLRIRVAEVAGYAPSIVSECTEHTSTNSAHVNEGRAYTETVYFSTRYYAVGSDEQLSGYSFSTTTLAEEPAGYFSVGSCDTSTSGETEFAPEVQNLVVTPIVDGLRIEGEVFDANADTVASVEARVEGVADWAAGTVDGNTFSVEVPATLAGSLSIEIQTEDVNGDTFAFTTTFDLDIGEPPVITFNNSWVVDDMARISGQTDDPDNAVNDFYYQVDGAGDPATGVWSTFTVDSTYWTIDVPNLTPGTHTIHFYGVDETAQRSNVLSTQVELVPLAAPECSLVELAPSSSRVAGELEIQGYAEDVNFSDIQFEYRVNYGAWVDAGSYSNLRDRVAFFFRLPDVYPDGSTQTVELRATDSSNLQTNCGLETVTIEYPTQDIAPTCEIVDIFQYDGAIRFFMSTNDPNGDVQQMYSKTPDMAEWIQTWPGAITTHQVAIPNFGDVTVEGRVVDSAGLEGFCQANFNVVDQQIAPEVRYVSGRYDVNGDTVTAEAEVIDTDGDVALVEFREVGSNTWVAGSLVPEDLWKRRWGVDFGLLPNGDYVYEVRATDAGGRISDVVSFEFNVTREEAPTLDSLAYQLNGTTITVSGTKSDVNSNDRYVWYRLDSQDWQSFWESDAQFSFSISGLEDGPHTLEVYVEDTYDLRSDSQFINFDIDLGLPPVVTNVTYEVLADRVNFTVTADDPDGDPLVLTRIYDGQSQGTLSNGAYVFNVTWLDVAAGTHSASFYVTDSFGNQSNTETVEFEIVNQTPCYEDTNANHQSAGRAYTEVVGQTCFGTICFGGTTTYFATGSTNDMGTSASAVNALLETSPGYYELGVCNDTTPPVITLSGANPLELSQGAAFVEPGYSASDNVDGDIASSVVITGSVDTSIVGSYTLTYSVSDSSGNPAAPVTRTVNVSPDTVIPVITIPGGLTYEVVVNSGFTNPTAVATDNVDGDISANVVVTGTVDTSTVGQYLLRYNVSDASNNAAEEVVVTVDVVDQPVSQCFTDTIDNHVTAGRVEIRYTTSYYTVVPAGQTAAYIGSTVLNGGDVISLEDIAEGHWTQVTTCN